MIILNNVVRTEFDMRQYLSDIRDMRMQSGQTLTVFGVLPDRAGRKTSVVSRNQNFHQVVNVVHSKDGDRQVPFGSITKNLRNQTYKWDPTDAEPIIAELFADTGLDYDNLSGADAMRLLNRMYSVIKEHCLHDGQFTGQIMDVMLKPDYLRSLGIDEDTPRGLLITTLESNLDTLGLGNSMLLEFNMNAVDWNSTTGVLAKWLVQYSLGRRFNDVFRTFANEVIPRRDRGRESLPASALKPQRMPASALRQMPPHLQAQARKMGWA